MKLHCIYTKFYKKKMKKYTKSFVFESRNPARLLKNKNYVIDDYNYTNLFLQKQKEYEAYLAKKELKKKQKQKKTYSYPSNLDAMIIQAEKDEKKEEERKKKTQNIKRFFSIKKKQQNNINFYIEKNKKMKATLAIVRKLMLKNAIISNTSTLCLKTKLLFLPSYKKKHRLLFKLKFESQRTFLDNIVNIKNNFKINKKIKKTLTKMKTIRNVKRALLFNLKKTNNKQFFYTNITERMLTNNINLNLKQYKHLTSFFLFALTKRFQYKRQLFVRFLHYYTLQDAKYFAILKTLILKIKKRRKLKMKHNYIFLKRLKKIKVQIRQNKRKIFNRYKLNFNMKKERKHKFYKNLYKQISRKKTKNKQTLFFSEYYKQIIKKKSKKQLIFAQWKNKLYKYILRYILKTINTRRIRTKNTLEKFKQNIFNNNKKFISLRYIKAMNFKQNINNILKQNKRNVFMLQIIIKKNLKRNILNLKHNLLLKKKMRQRFFRYKRNFLLQKNIQLNKKNIFYRKQNNYRQEKIKFNKQN